MAGTALYSASVLSEAANGRKLPSLAVTRAYVRACEGDVVAWESRWRRLATELAQTTVSDSDQDRMQAAPYVGLRCLQVEDADRFFGRERLTADLTARVRRRRLVVVLGASGSGKSSLLRAGLLAQARTIGLDQTGPTSALLLTPGAHPIEECAVQVAAWSGRSATALRAEFTEHPDSLHLHVRQALAQRSEPGDVLLVVDQCEELFTLCQDPRERDTFLALLTAAMEADTSRVRVVLGIRADFLPQCTEYPVLVRAITDAAVIVGPMSADELRLVVTEPARREGLAVETALVTRLVADAVAQPAALPMVSHALLATWRRRRGTTLTLQGYEAVGGIQDAVARTAEDQYQALSTDQQALAQQLFLRLVALSDLTAEHGTPDTRRRITHGEVAGFGLAMQRVVARLVRARLITSAETGVEIAHEALIHAWPRLRGWLEEDRAGLRVHRQLTEAAQQWESSGRDRDVLYRGSRLLTTQEWHTTTERMLTANEREFLATSLAAQARERTVARRRTRRLRQLVALLAVLVVVATTTTVTAIQAEQVAARQRDVALADTALAEAAAVRGSDPGLALQLTQAAYGLASTPQTSGELLNAAAAPYVQQLNVRSQVVAFSPDGRLMATIQDGQNLQIWDITGQRQPVIIATVTGLIGPAMSAAFSPNSRVLTVSETSGAQLWDLTTPRHPHPLASPPGIDAAALCADGHLMATAGASGGVLLWDSSDLRRPLGAVPTGPAPAASVALSADGHTLAVQETATGQDSQVQLWDVSNPSQPVPAAVGITSVDDVQAMAFSPTAPILAVATDNGPIVLWDVTHPRQPVRAGEIVQPDRTLSVAFSPDGQTIAAGSEGGALSTWNVDDPGQPRQTTGLTAASSGIDTVAFVRGGNTVVVASSDFAIHLITVPQFALASDTQDVTAAAISSDGHTLATADAMIDTESFVRTQIWDLTDLNQPTPTTVVSTDPPPSDPAAVGLAFSPRGTILATTDDQHIRLWDIRDRQHPQHLATLPAHGVAAAFSPDGQTLATISDDNHAHLWDIHQPQHPRQLADIDLGVLIPSGTPSVAEPPSTMAFSPRGHILAIASPDGYGGKVVQLWDTTNPSAVHVITSLPDQSGSTIALAFDPSGRLLSTGDTNGTIQLWDIANPTLPGLLSTLTGSPNSDNPVAFSPDGHTMATPGVGQTVQLWDLTDPAHPTLRAVLPNALLPVMFHPNGHTLAVIGTNQSVQLRETNINDATTQLCATTPRISQATWDHYFPQQPYQPPC
jgi:WD40 repeat protein/energy-coupling factor transporter ATP-binding protein EcfA2